MTEQSHSRRAQRAAARQAAADRDSPRRTFTRDGKGYAVRRLAPADLRWRPLVARTGHGAVAPTVNRSAR